MKITTFKTQLIFTFAVYILIAIITTSNFDFYEGVTNSIIIILITLFFKLVLAYLIKVKKSPMLENEEFNSSAICFVMRFMQLVINVLLVITIFITVLAGIGTQVSDVSINVFHVFLLVIPFWFTLKGDIQNLINEFNKVI